jgi:uncharacterized protein (TIGR02246 family)
MIVHFLRIDTSGLEVTMFSPQDLHQALVTAFNARDMDAVVALYEPEAVLVPQPGQIASGSAQLRAALAHFFALPGDMSIETTYCLQQGELALTRSHWKVQTTEQVTVEAEGTEIMRRQPDGSWRFVVDHPFGAE